ncbi:hypothetical protein Rhopal_004674-T1 [Rhodotorula paludigena]|uniref:NADP-dependent oxidoreductase domain-containing protein n=1 Tax=Rhodotorula paludigena TaxID=86838 RepID=A0AAV5GGB1_9BASI|nr:hypothetical protein Rhopal_004674-T1 [Rhodotorula paludigena]
MSSFTTNVPVTLGLMTWGREGVEMARVHDLATCEEMLDILQKHGHNEVDTALVYGDGSSEEYLGQTRWKERGIVVDTKLFPGQYAGRDVKFTLESIRKQIEVQLAAVKTQQFDLWYLHAPDASTPLEVTAEAVNTLYKEGKFKRFGISNYSAAQTEQLVHIAEKNGWSIYNALHRTVEKDLFPILRKHNISFYEFNPLGGGFFTGAVQRDSNVEKGSRFDPETAQGKNYRSRYWREEFFRALDKLQPVADKHSLTLAEIALRWIQHHSLLERAHGDNVLIGASSVKHLEANLADMEKGSLPQDVLDALDQGWELVKDVASPYHR